MYRAGLPPTNPVRLGLALNFAIFQHDVLGEKVRAGELAWSALHDAVQTMDAMQPDEYASTTATMKRLRETLRYDANS